MFAYVARQPIFDSKKNVYAYELLFRDGENNRFPDINPDEATSKILAASHLSVGVEEITGGKPAFINFHQDTLLYRFPTSLDPDNVVIEILETVEVTENLLKACQHMRKMGYKVALDDYDFDPKWDVFLPHVNIIKVDIRTCGMPLVMAKMPSMQSLKIKWVAEKVETYQEFSQLKDLGFDYFQGYFFAKPEIIKHKNIGVTKTALLELVAASSAAVFDLNKINDVIQRDVALSYMLLRFINNPTINKRHKITSLRHALNYMGEIEIRKFIALLALAKLSDNKPEELVVSSLVRARFCELVADKMGESNNPPTGFLVGLFSLLDAMLDQGMEELMAKLPLSDIAKQALCGHINNFQRYLSLACDYEMGNWSDVESNALALNIPLSYLDTSYKQAIAWCTSIKSSV